MLNGALKGWKAGGHPTSPQQLLQQKLKLSRKLSLFQIP
jgi:hypothetical protein